MSEFATGFFAATAFYLREEGQVTPTIRNLFKAAGDPAQADPSDLELFVEHQLLPANYGTRPAKKRAGPKTSRRLYACPRGWHRVKSGTTNSGDRVWCTVKKAWVPVDSVNEYVSEYHAVIRHADGV